MIVNHPEYSIFEFRKDIDGEETSRFYVVCYYRSYKMGHDIENIIRDLKSGFYLNHMPYHMVSPQFMYNRNSTANDYASFVRSVGTPGEDPKFDFAMFTKSVMDKSGYYCFNLRDILSGAIWTPEAEYIRDEYHHFPMYFFNLDHHKFSMDVIFSDEIMKGCFYTV